LYSKTNIFYEYAGVIISSILSAAGLVFTIRKNFKQNFMLRYEKNDLIALLQEQKRQADEANLAKTKFLAAASHDLRQPLQSTTLLLSALARYLTEEKQLGILSKARSSLNSLSELLNSLLDISKLDAGLIQVQPSNFNLNTLIHEEVGKYNDLAKHKGLCINVKLNSPISVCSDPVLLRRIMSNLLENAIRYSSAGTIQIMAASLDGNLVIEIQDQGVGIDPQYHETIFKEFYQIENPERDRKKGLGLGLAIVNRLVGLLGGSIHLESEVGQGSTFSIRFGKITLKEEVFRDLNPKNEPHPLPVLRVLVIDDEIQVRESMGILLESWGCEALLAGDLNGALSLLEPNPNIDIMIVDYRLRNHQTGTQCIEKIYKELGHPIPAIIITGDTEEAIIRELEMSGHPFLHKPIDDLSLHQYLLALSDQ
jgi:signal transduction histidine kinase/CheY-like chemotaxis protein